MPASVLVNRGAVAFASKHEVNNLISAAAGLAFARLLSSASIALAAGIVRDEAACGLRSCPVY
jgi:hypothetical protein